MSVLILKPYESILNRFHTDFTTPDPIEKEEHIGKWLWVKEVISTQSGRHVSIATETSPKILIEITEAFQLRKFIHEELVCEEDVEVFDHSVLYACVGEFVFL
jgi:hypothetical protein